MRAYYNKIYTFLPSFLQEVFDRIIKSDIGRRVASGAVWSLNSAIVSRLLSLISSILVARIVGKTVFGELGIIQSTIGMLGTLAGMGMGLTATKFIAEYRDNDKEKVGRIIKMSYKVSFYSGFLLSLVLFFLSSKLATDSLSAPELSRPLKISAAILLLTSLAGSQNGILAGFESFRKIAFINLWTGIASFPIMLAGAYFIGLDGLVIGLILTQIVTLIFNSSAIKKVLFANGIKINNEKWFNELDVIWKYSLPAILSNVVVAPVMWLGNSILVNQNNGYAEMGIFSAANQWRLALMFLPTILTTSLLPVFSNENSNEQRFIKIFDNIHKLNIGIILPIYFLIVLCSKLIMKLYGQSFENGYIVLIAVIAATSINGIGAPAGTALQSKGKMWLGFIMNLSWGIVFMIGSYLFIPVYGAIGLALAFLISYAFLTLWGYVYLRSYLTMKIFVRTILSVLLIILSSIMVIYMLWQKS